MGDRFRGRVLPLLVHMVLLAVGGLALALFAELTYYAVRETSWANQFASPGDYVLWALAASTAVGCLAAVAGICCVWLRPRLVWPMTRVAALLILMPSLLFGLGFLLLG